MRDEGGKTDADGGVRPRAGVYLKYEMREMSWVGDLEDACWWLLVYVLQRREPGVPRRVGSA
jgi:hypothetical protein